MSILDDAPHFVKEELSRQIASRQVLPFFGLSARTDLHKGRARFAPSKSLFSLDAFLAESFRQDGPIFNWRTRPIYDVHQRLLFYDHTLPLAGGNELHVRSAASSFLLTPVWSIQAGKARNIDGLISKAVSVVQQTPNLETVDKENVRLVCYGYPRLGILCVSKDPLPKRFVMDLWDLNLIPVSTTEELYNRAESVKTIWSPYDFISTATAAFFRFLFQTNLAFLDSLPELPERVEDLPITIIAAGGTIEASATTNPELIPIGQQNSFFCAAATMKMILDQHGFPRTQDDIAVAMNTIFGTGARPEDQESAVGSLTGQNLDGELDPSASFEEARREIEAHRPFRTGDISHARACGGFVLEGSGKRWLYICDPLPTGAGSTYYEAWDLRFHCNYIYVTPVKYS